MTSGSPTEAKPPGPAKPGAWVAFLGLACGLAGLAALAASGVGYRLGWWAVPTALGLARYAAYTAALGFGLSLVGLLVALRRRRGRGVVAGLLGLIAALPLVVLAAQWTYAARSYPAINDITTDTEDPPVFWDMPSPGDYTDGETAALQRAAYPDLQPLTLEVAPERAFTLALALARDTGWEIVAEAPDEGRIEAVATTFFYGFKDEVVIRIEPSGSGATVDLRSRSRIGRSDLGANAARIRDFLAELGERAAEEG